MPLRGEDASERSFFHRYLQAVPKGSPRGTRRATAQTRRNSSKGMLNVLACKKAQSNQPQAPRLRPASR